MQPIYCTWEANGATAHTPGLFKRGRVNDVHGWINAAVGELARITVQGDGQAAREQRSAAAWIDVPKGCKVTWDAKQRVLRIERTAEGL